MKRERYYYILRIQYLGFRYSGWQKQPGQKTVEGMLSKTLKFVLPGTSCKILGSGRTDAKVSSLGGAFELFVDQKPIKDLPLFLQELNLNLPPDIRVLDCAATSETFNVIKDIREKEYQYLFSYGSKNHPFCAPIMANFIEDLDLAKMREAAPLFEGTHNFRAYTTRLQKNTTCLRTINKCQILVNTEITASFFPRESYLLVVKGRGFMRYQIRMIMGALIQLGKGELSLAEIEASLKEDSEIMFSYVAPGSGLTLKEVWFQ